MVLLFDLFGTHLVAKLSTTGRVWAGTEMPRRGSVQRAILVTSETYTTKASAVPAINSVRDNAATVRVDDLS